MNALEERLEALHDGANVSLNDVRRACSTRLASRDEALAAVRALLSIGALKRTEGGYQLDRKEWERSAAYREGVRDGLSVDSYSGDRARLCAALPQGLRADVSEAIRRSTLDLRGAIVDLASSARADLLLASPFWDEPTLAELADVLRNRLCSGVALRLLGRFDATSLAQIRETLTPLSAKGRCEVYSWYDARVGVAAGIQTFHFKSAIADGGIKAYLGSANFTWSGLRSRLELGVILEGDIARSLFRVVENVVSLADPVAL